MSASGTHSHIARTVMGDIQSAAPCCPQCRTEKIRKSYTLWHERLRNKRMYYCQDCTLHFYWSREGARRVDRVRYCRCGTDMDLRASKTALERGIRSLGLRLYTCRRCANRRFRP